MTKQVIHKATISEARCTIETGGYAVLLHVGVQNGEITAWYTCDTTGSDTINFRVLFTGEEYDEEELFDNNFHYVGTVTGVHGWIVAHVFSDGQV